MPGWADQKLSISLLELMRRIRLIIRSGDVNLREFDHNHPTKNGLSNKMVWLGGRDLLGRPPRDMDEAWGAFMEAMGI